MAEGYTLERLGSESKCVSIGSDCVSEECTKTKMSTRNSVCNYSFPFDDEARRPERAQSKYESPYRILYHPQMNSEKNWKFTIKSYNNVWKQYILRINSRTYYRKKVEISKTFHLFFTQKLPSIPITREKHWWWGTIEDEVWRGWSSHSVSRDLTRSQQFHSRGVNMPVDCPEGEKNRSHRWGYQDRKSLVLFHQRILSE